MLRKFFAAIPGQPNEPHPTEGLPDAERTRHDALQAESTRFQDARNALRQEHAANVAKIEDEFRSASATEPTTADPASGTNV